MKDRNLLCDFPKESDCNDLNSYVQQVKEWYKNATPPVLKLANMGLRLEEEIERREKLMSDLNNQGVVDEYSKGWLKTLTLLKIIQGGSS